QNSAKLVFAVDVGTNQLAWKLRQDPRVVSMEQFNFRYAEKTDFEQEPSFASIDVSFISLSLILPALHRVLADQGQVVALVKPQFEAGREQIGKNGIIRDAKIHQNVLESVTAMAVEAGFSVLGLDFSPIQGGHGNIEFLAYLKKEKSASNQIFAEIKEAVERAHSQFKNE
ncbi:TPA: TlyA family RNA methyltransferase, partial [Streptococcus pneumoniae]|nr:TlyA family RNA methyltransferase [Streptococcus pneumoniae]